MNSLLVENFCWPYELTQSQKLTLLYLKSVSKPHFSELGKTAQFRAI